MPSKPSDTPNPRLDEAYHDASRRNALERLHFIYITLKTGLRDHVDDCEFIKRFDNGDVPEEGADAIFKRIAAKHFAVR